MKHVKRAAPFIALVVAAVVIPVLASTLSGSEADTAASATSDVNLDLVILVNRMELTKEQMQTLHDIVVGIVGQRDGLRVALEDKRATLEAEMIAFRGTEEELDARLAAYRAEVAALLESTRDAQAAAVEELGELLTYNQGVLLERILPRLDGALTGDIRAQIRSRETDRGARWLSLRGSAPAGLNRLEGDPPPCVAMNWGFGWAMPGALEGQERWGETSPQADAETAPSTSSPSGTRSGQGPLMRFIQRQTGNAVGFWRMQAPSERQGGHPVLEELIRVLELKLGQA
jgi:hypothetical protein